MIRRTLFPLLVALATLAPPALAQDEEEPPAAKEATPEELAAARALFVEGKALETEGKWDEALARFETVAKVKMTPQVRFHIALCHENVGRWVDAVNGFELAEQEARAAGDLARDVFENAPKRAEALRKRVAHVTIRVEGEVRTSKLFIDDKEVSLALAGTTIPIDPGDHVLQVRRGDEVIESRDLSFAEAESQEVELEIHDPQPPPPDPEPKVVPKPDVPPVIPDEPPPQWIAYVVAGAGAASLGLSGVFFGLRQSRLAKIECETDDFKQCDPAFKADADAAQTFHVGSLVTLGVGITAVAAGVGLWFLLWPDDDPDPTATGARAEVRVVPTPGGIVVQGRF
ncbi:MAG: hypothetical protein KC731_25170 [Myxococcales bacterium]|nr:hypothetical protein [Myxococcales bacterium]